MYSTALPPLRVACACKCLSTVKSRSVASRMCAPLCRRNLFKYHKKNVFWLQIPFLWLLFSPPGGDGGGVKWSSDIDAPVKTIVPPFPKTGNRARFTYLCENTIFFLASPARKDVTRNRFQIPTSSCDVSSSSVG